MYGRSSNFGGQNDGRDRNFADMQQFGGPKFRGTFQGRGGGNRFPDDGHGDYHSDDYGRNDGYHFGYENAPRDRLYGSGNSTEYDGNGHGDDQPYGQRSSRGGRAGFQQQPQGRETQNHNGWNDKNNDFGRQPQDPNGRWRGPAPGSWKEPEQAPLDVRCVGGLGENSLTKIKKLNCQVCKVDLDTFEEFQAHANSLFHINNAALAAERSASSSWKAAEGDLAFSPNRRLPHQEMANQMPRHHTPNEASNQRFLLTELPNRRQPTASPETGPFSRWNQSQADMPYNHSRSPEAAFNHPLPEADRKFQGGFGRTPPTKASVGPRHVQEPKDQRGLLGPAVNALVNQALQASAGVCNLMQIRDGNRNRGQQHWQGRGKQALRNANFSKNKSRASRKGGNNNNNNAFNQGHLAHSQRSDRNMAAERSTANKLRSTKQGFVTKARDRPVAAGQGPGPKNPRPDADGTALKPDSSSTAVQQRGPGLPKFEDEEEVMDIELNFTPAQDATSEAEHRPEETPEAIKSDKSAEHEEVKSPEPIGQEYIVQTKGFFCKLCSRFYTNETMAKVEHCKSEEHVAKYMAAKGQKE